MATMYTFRAINYLGGKNEKSFMGLPWHNITDCHQAFSALGIP